MLHIDIPKYIILYIILLYRDDIVPLKYYFHTIRCTLRNDTCTYNYRVPIIGFAWIPTAYYGFFFFFNSKTYTPKSQEDSVVKCCRFPNSDCSFLQYLLIMILILFSVYFRKYLVRWFVPRFDDIIILSSIVYTFLSAKYYYWQYLLHIERWRCLLNKKLEEEHTV